MCPPCQFAGARGPGAGGGAAACAPYAPPNPPPITARPRGGGAWFYLCVSVRRLITLSELFGLLIPIPWIPVSHSV
jgi:hypothetical protein